MSLTVLFVVVVLWAVLPLQGVLAEESTDPVSFLHYWTDDMSGGVNEMTARFSAENPDSPIQATGFEHEAFKISINVMLDSGTPPDMFSYWAGARVQALVDKGHLEPIDDIWAAADLDAKLSPAVSQACTHGEHAYILPLTQHYVCFFYNKALFEQAGVSPPATWEEFLNVCARLKEQSITPIALGARHRWPAQFWFDMLLLRTAGPEYRRQLVQGQASYTDAEVIRAFGLWRELLQAGYFLDRAEALDWADAAKAVHGGEAAMTLMGTWIIGLFDGPLGWRQLQDYEYFVFPVIDPNVPMVALGPIDGIVVPTHGDVAAAKQALVYFAEPGPQMAMSRGSGALVPVSDIAPDFYPPMQQRIADTVASADEWAFNYDLATPPPVAKLGLETMAHFVADPTRLEELLAQLQDNVSRLE